MTNHHSLLWMTRRTSFRWNKAIRFSGLDLVSLIWLFLVIRAHWDAFAAQSFIITRAWLVISATAGCAMRRSAVMAWNCTRHFSD